MKIWLRKVATLVVASSLAVVAPAVVPLPAAGQVVRGCGVVQFTPLDIAYASGGLRFVPCPSPKVVSPWPAFVVVAAAASTIIDAIFVWNTQCRELNIREAMLAAGLPVVGWAFNDANNQCHKGKK